VSARAGGGEGGRDALFATRWLHAYEEDDAEGAVYRPEDADFPLSRRPRAGLELSADGTARVLAPGPDDRPRPHAGTWREEHGEIVVATPAGDYRVVAWSPDRLVVKRP
jgi:hypothetical protein